MPGDRCLCAWPVTGQGVTPQASRPLACRKGGCVTARDRPPSCLRQGRGGCTPGEPLSCLRQERGVAPRASRLLACGKGGGCTPGKPLSCLRQERGVAPWASRLLACGKGGKLHTAARRKHAGVYGRPILLARLAAGRSCLFLGLAAGEASPAASPKNRQLLPAARRASNMGLPYTPACFRLAAV